MDYSLFKILHLLSIVALGVSFGVLLCGLWQGSKNSLRKWGFIGHGVSWLMVFITAYGLVGALNMHLNFPGWAKAKTLIFVLLGIYVFVAKKTPRFIALHTTIILGLCTLAISLAVMKPNILN